MNDIIEFPESIADQERIDAITRAQALSVQEAMAELVRTGTVAQAALKFGDALAAQALHDLTEQAPTEIASSWSMVVAWARMQRAYEKADRVGDTQQMLASARAQADLVRERYR